MTKLLITIAQVQKVIFFLHLRIRNATKEAPMKDNMTDTQKFTNYERLIRNEVSDILLKVYAALKEKGYNPINQIVGYILSGDPTYITSHKNARTLIGKLERDELLEEIVRSFLVEQSEIAAGGRWNEV